MEVYVPPSDTNKIPLPSVEVSEYVGLVPFGHIETRSMTAEEMGLNPADFS